MSRGSRIAAWGESGCLLLCLASLAWPAVLTHAGGGEFSSARISEEMERHGVGPLPGAKSLERPFEFEGQRGRNVIGYLPASGAEGSVPTGAAILLGTHYADAETDGAGAAHPATGWNESADVTAVLLTVKKLAASPLRHPVIVAFWSDKGGPRSGSRAFIEQAGIPATGFLACVHLDGVGALSENRLDVLGAGSSPAWRGLVERANVPVGFDIAIEDDPEMPRDSFSFHQAEIPAVSVTAGGHGEFASTTGETTTLEHEELQRVARFASLLVRRLDRLDAPPGFVAFERAQTKPEPAKQLAYTGTIPDYTAEVEGLLLSGVVAGGPAEAAGLAAGDVIIEFAGGEVSDIYGYRDALEAAEVGRPLQVVFIRDGERREVTVVPTVRP